MTDQARENLRSFSAFLLRELGIYFPEGDPTLPYLFAIHKDMELNNRTNKEIASLIQQALSKINPKEFKFYSGDAALKFQNGITLRWGIIGTLILLFFWIAAWHWSTVNDVHQAKIIIGASGKTTELLKCVKKDNEGFYYFDFSEAKGKSIQNFKEFERLNAKTVRVYLGKE
jgi:hypothetical protein